MDGPLKSSYLVILPALIICMAAFTVAILFLAGVLLPSRRPVKVSARDLYVDILGARIRYRVVNYGDAAIVLLHGFGESLDKWEPLVRHLSCTRVISLDIIGFGGSGCPDVSYDLQTHRRYLLSFMEAMNVRQAVLVGSSMGASIAAWTASNSPERVRAVVLSAPSGYPGSLRHRWPAGMFYRPGRLNRIARAIVGISIFEKMFPNSLGPQALDVTSSYDINFRDSLSNIRQPVVLFWSNGDRRVPASFSKMYLERIPHAELVKLPVEAGHNAIMFNPAEASRFICDLLGK